MGTEITKPRLEMLPPLGQGLGAIHAEIDPADMPELIRVIVDECMEPVGPNPTLDCFDERGLVQMMSGETTVPVGYHAAGGAMTIVAARELGTDLSFRPSVEEAVREDIETFEKSGLLRPAAHRDSDHMEKIFEGDSGCGGADGYVPRIRLMAHEQYAPILEEVTKAYIAPLNFDGAMVDAAALHTRQRAAEYIDSPSVEGWEGGKLCKAFSQAELAEDWKSRIQVLEVTHEGVHGHTGVALGANYRHGESVDQKKVIAKTGKKAFVFDVPALEIIAQVHTVGPEAAPTQEYINVLFAGLEYDIVTAFGLTDGSQGRFNIF